MKSIGHLQSEAALQEVIESWLQDCQIDDMPWQHGTDLPYLMAQAAIAVLRGARAGQKALVHGINEGETTLEDEGFTI